MESTFMERRLAQMESRHEAGRKYAKQECAALAGMAEDPKMPEECENDPDFEAGYQAYLEDPDAPSTASLKP
jgi:hypothetical protein